MGPLTVTIEEGASDALPTLTEETPEDRLGRWRKWLEDDLFKQIHQLVRQREVLKSWNDIVDVASLESKRHGLFHTWVNYNYIDSLVMGVRRMSDPGTRTRSLVRLLTEIKEHATDLTQDWWEGRWWQPQGDPTAEYIAEFNELSSEGEWHGVHRSHRVTAAPGRTGGR